MSVVNIGSSDKEQVKYAIVFCPGCSTRHAIPIETPPGHPTGPWTWNGDLDKPTFTPSLRVRWGEGFKYCCHSHITDGRIAFQADSTHAFAGQTLDLSAH